VQTLERTPWLDDDENLAKWEDNTLTASDRRILLTNWYFKAVEKALQGDAKRNVSISNMPVRCSPPTAPTMSSSSSRAHRVGTVSKFRL
jgi:hypothetical protein